MTDARDGQSRTVRQFQFMDWPEQVNEHQLKCPGSFCWTFRKKNPQGITTQAEKNIMQFFQKSQAKLFKNSFAKEK